MPLYSSFVYYKCNISKLPCLQQIKHVAMEICLWYLNPNVKHPDIIERQFAVVAAKHIQLAVHYISSVATPRSGAIVTGLHFFPHVLVNIEYVHIIHPMSTIVPSKVIYL